MSKYRFIVIFSIIFCFGQIVSANAQSSGSVSVSVTDNRKIITRNIDKNLLLRIVKDSSVKHKHFGWLVEVVRKPFKVGARNLIYTNNPGVGADRSQVYAWHVAGNEFPNEREIKVRGYPYSVKISLIDAKTAGSGPNARFNSGTLQVSWTRQK
jgi:hypothetical protein